MRRLFCAPYQIFFVNVVSLTPMMYSPISIVMEPESRESAPMHSESAIPGSTNTEYATVLKNLKKKLDEVEEQWNMLMTGACQQDMDNESVASDFRISNSNAKEQFIAIALRIDEFIQKACAIDNTSLNDDDDAAAPQGPGAVVSNKEQFTTVAMVQLMMQLLCHVLHLMYNLVDSQNVAIEQEASAESYRSDLYYSVGR